MKVNRRFSTLILLLIFSMSIQVSVFLFNASEARAKEVGEVGSPYSPTNLSATTLSQSQINLVWEAPSLNELAVVKKYVIYRTEGNNTNFNGLVPLAILDVNSTSYSDLLLSPSTQYNYKVAAQSEGGAESGNSNLASATTLSAPATAPTNLTATAVSNSQINLSWTAASSGADLYYVYHKGPGDSDFVMVNTVSGGVTTYSDTGLTPATTYTYKVSTYKAGMIVDSNPASATTNSNVSSGSGTVIPTIQLTATALTQTQIGLKWNTIGGADGYTIYRRGPNDIGFSALGQTSSGIDSYTDMGLMSGTRYAYYVIGSIPGGGIKSNEDNATTPGTSGGGTSTGGNPSANPVINLTATGVCAVKIDLSWNIIPGAAYYNVYRSVNDTSNFVYLDHVYTGSYTDFNVEKGKTYNYKVIAADSNSTVSNIIGVQFICDGNPSSGGGIIIVVGGTTGGGQSGGTSGSGSSGWEQPGGGIIIVTSGGGSASPDCLPSDIMPSVEWRGRIYNNPFNPNSGVVFGVLPDKTTFRYGEQTVFRYCWQNTTDQVRRIKVTRQLVDEDGNVKGVSVSDVKTLQPHEKFTLDRTRILNLSPGLYKEEVVIDHLYNTFGAISLDESNGFYFKIGDEGNGAGGESGGGTMGSVPTVDSPIVPDPSPGAPGTPGIVLERLPKKDTFRPGEVIPFTPAYIPPAGDSGEVVYKFKLVRKDGKPVKLDPPGVSNPGIKDPIKGGGGDPGVGDPGKGSRRNVLVRLPKRLPPGTYRIITEVRRGGAGGGVVDTASLPFTVYQGSK